MELYTNVLFYGWLCSLSIVFSKFLQASILCSSPLLSNILLYKRSTVYLFSCCQAPKLFLCQGTTLYLAAFRHSIQYPTLWFQDTLPLPVDSLLCNYCVVSSELCQIPQTSEGTKQATRRLLSVKTMRMLIKADPVSTLFACSTVSS